MGTSLGSGREAIRKEVADGIRTVAPGKHRCFLSMRQYTASVPRAVQPLAGEAVVVRQKATAVVHDTPDLQL